MDAPLPNRQRNVIPKFTMDLSAVRNQSLGSGFILLNLSHVAKETDLETGTILCTCQAVSLSEV